MRAKDIAPGQLLVTTCNLSLRALGDRGFIPDIWSLININAPVVALATSEDVVGDDVLVQTPVGPGWIAARLLRDAQDGGGGR